MNVNIQGFASGNMTSYTDAVINRSGKAPDIRGVHFWEDPKRQEQDAFRHRLFSARAAESRNTADPQGHAWRRYFDPTARHFVGGDLTDDERMGHWHAELRMIRGDRYLAGCSTLTALLDGRGLNRSGSSTPSTPRTATFCPNRENTERRNHSRSMLGSQLRDLFAQRGVFIPENMRISFIIDSKFNLRVSGTDNESLIKKIEEILNANGNSAQLFLHIISTDNNNKLNEESLRRHRLERTIREYTGFHLRDLEVVNGKFVTDSGEDIFDIFSRALAKDVLQKGPDRGFFGSHIKYELRWLALEGINNVPELVLQIDFENGHLIDAD